MTTQALHTSTVKALPGVPYPLDCAYDGTGTNFSVFSEVAERIKLCLFDDEGKETRISLNERDGYNWHVYVTGVGPGQLYGYRVHGPWDPKNGIRCCPNKLLLDPSSKAVSGSIQWSDALFPYRIDKADAATCSSSDDARLMVKSVVHNPFFNWNNEYRAHTPLEDTIIYEMHVKGFTKRHPAVPPEQRGTYAGVTHPAVIEYLKSLGITAVELMPVHQFVHDRTLIDKGLRNYWGHNSICYGVEGETNDPAINDLRAREVRNSLTTLLLSQGVPMIRGGDEIGQTKWGNNNAYCQDNEISWFDWERADQNLKEFTAQLIHLRQDHPVFHRRGWYQGRSIRGSVALEDIGWFRPDAAGMSADDWKQGYVKSLQVFLNGDLGYMDRRGEPVCDDDFLVLFNAGQEDVFFQLALSEKERPWQIVLNTSTRIEDGVPSEKQSGSATVKAEGRSVIVLTRPRK